MAKSSTATQSFLPFTDIRDGIVIMGDGSLRAILMSSSLNLALKSGDEQAAVLGQFQNMLNSLDFPVQFVVQSRKLDIRPYLSLLEKEVQNETNDLLKIQIEEYIGFVRGFVDEVNVMTKHFFIVVPYTPATITYSDNPLTALFKSGKKNDKEASNKAFEENRSQLEQRVGVVEQGLRRTGVRTALLGTEEVVELFYRIFNPDDQERPVLYRGS